MNGKVRELFGDEEEEKCKTLKGKVQNELDAFKEKIILRSPTADAENVENFMKNVYFSKTQVQILSVDVAIDISFIGKCVK